MKSKRMKMLICCVVLLAAVFTAMKYLGRQTTLEAELAVEVPFDETVEYIYVRTHALVVGSYSNIGDVWEAEHFGLAAGD